MTDHDPGLVLHIPFSDALDAGPIDRSAKRHEVTVGGGPLLVADATLGAAHRFTSGDYLQVTGLGLAAAPAFTLSLWAKREAAEARVQLFALGAAGQGQLVLYLRPDGIPELYLEYPDGGAATELFDALLPTGAWVHLALGFDGETLGLFRDGQPLGRAVPAPGFTLRRRLLTLSSPRPDAGPSFRGSLAQLRVHDNALTGDVIRDHLAADRGLRARFVDSHPILLSLLDSNDAAALYITEHASGEPLGLELANVAGRPVRLLPPFGAVGPDNYHFELRFRPGTLARSAIDPERQPLALAGSDAWAMSAPTPQADGSIAFYLAHRTPDDEPVTIPADARLRLELTNARADPAGGARNARVELRYGRIALGDDPTPLNGSRISHVSILSHIGRHHLPLHVGFIGPNTVLPGAEVTDNRIRLRLTNTSPDLAILWTKGDPERELAPEPKPEPASCLELFFDYQAEGEEKDWALCRLEEAREIDSAADRDGPARDMVAASERSTLQSPLLGQLTGKTIEIPTPNGVHDAYYLVTAPAFRPRDGQAVIIYSASDGSKREATVRALPGVPENAVVLSPKPPSAAHDLVFIKPPSWQVRRSAPGTTPHWKIWSDDATHLAAGDHIDLTISGIVTTLPPGPANLYLRYRNIPGYQGGELTAVVEKSNVVVRDGKMGIGTNEPRHALHVADGPSDENDGAVYIGPGDEPTGRGNANLRLGHAGDYAYIQSHAGRQGANGLRINARKNQDVLLGSAGFPNRVGVGVDRAIAQLDVGRGHILLRSEALALSKIAEIMRNADPDDLLIVAPHGTNRTITFYWVETSLSHAPPTKSRVAPRVIRSLFSAELKLDGRMRMGSI